MTASKLPEFKPHSRIKRESGASAELMFTSCNIHTQRQCPAASAPDAAGRLVEIAIAVGVFATISAFVWVMS